MSHLIDYEVIVQPVITEKSVQSAAEGKYTFEVDIRANKLQIAEAVSYVFDVDVIKVNVLRSIPKFGRWGRKRVQRKSMVKKAIVTVAHGQTIEAFGV